MISRRRFITGFVIALTPLGATPSAREYKAQQAGKVYGIGSLTRGGREAAAPYNRALEEGLRALG